MTVLSVLVIAALLLVPGAALLAALRRRTGADALEDLGHAVALSIALLVVVGTALGHVGAYRFAATGLPALEIALLAVVAACAWIAFGRSPGTERTPAGGDA